MLKSNKYVKPFFIFLICASLCARGQQAPVNYSLKSVVGALNTFRDKMPVEKLYVQLDKPYYNSDDTLRFKAYLLNADFLTPSVRSGLLYIELDDAGGKMIKRMMVPVALGVSWGDIALVADDIPGGSYTLRAYTSWMLNFGEDQMFKKNIYISAVNGGATLINTNFKLSDKGDKTNIRAGLRFTGLNGQTLGLRDIGLRVMNGRKTLFRDKAATNIDGTMDINFDLADKTVLKNLSIQAQYRGKNADTTTLTIPVTINRPENTDLQFMPEGGNLVAGVSSKMGFKAISEDGKGININGKIINSKQQEVANFTSTHNGMGCFVFTPEASETYTAKIALGSVNKTYPLPTIHPAGTALKITNKGQDSLEVTLNTMGDVVNNAYYLIAQSRGVVCYAAAISLKESTIKKTIAKNVFPTGIARFTLLTNMHVPLNERIVYIDHNDNLNISIDAGKAVYGLRDSIALNVMVKDKDGKPAQGTFSLAVTDNDQIPADSIGNNMLNSFLFTSDLKGTVEEPGWYLENNTPERSSALDNLLLTQGWVGYDWKNVFEPVIPVPKYKAEKEFLVQGKLTNFFNKPMIKGGVTLLQKNPLMSMDTLTDNDGKFAFKGLFPTDSAYYLIQATNKNKNSFNVGVNMDEFIPPVFEAPKQRIIPWYVNSDTTLLNNTQTKIAQLKAEADYKGEGRLLKTVVINDKKIIPGSHNLNPDGGADFILDEKEMNAAKKMTLYELLKKKYTDIYKTNRGGHFTYTFMGRLLTLVIDGVFVKGGNPLPMDLYMDDLTAEDIKGIEIMYTPRYIFEYDPWITKKFTMLMERFVPLYLEITTYSGHGAYLKRTPGRYIYKPVGSAAPTEFYSPKYTNKSKSIAMGTDLRSTIYWEPNVATDETGKATVSFYSADKPADYTVIIEGTDLNGNIGYSRRKIKVAK